MCAVFFDFRKAFNLTRHWWQRFVPWICLIRWLNNYLADRSQVVAVNGSVSSEAAVLSGLRPLLFLIYVDDLPRVNLFTDDILLYHLISNPADYILLQLAVSSIEEWSKSNYLLFNAGKCKYMIVSRKQSSTVKSNPSNGLVQVLY